MSITRHIKRKNGHRGSFPENSVYIQSFEWYMKMWDIPDNLENRAFHAKNVGTKGKWMLDLIARGTSLDEISYAVNTNQVLKVSAEWLDDQEKSNEQHKALDNFDSQGNSDD